MFDKEIGALLHKSLSPLPFMLCDRSLRHDIDDLAAMLLPGMRLAVVADAHTAQVLGEQVHRAVKGGGDAKAIFLDAGIAADMAAVEHIRHETQGYDALIAVGGGTISDIAKYASFLDRKPYIVFPTAASMNGYLSANASITVEGYKKTLAAHMPRGVLCDLSVITAAPARLNKSGLGDALARPTAQADWLLSHLLLGTPYDDMPFALLAPLEARLFDNARGIALGDPASVEILLETLLLSGLGMTIAGGSYPASQAEHMIAHAMHMLRGQPLPLTFHGEEIGVTTLAMARMQEALLRKSSPALRPTAFPAASMAALFGEHSAAEAQKACRVKQDAMEKAGLHGEIAPAVWEPMAQKLQAVMLPPAKIQSVLNAAQAPDTPQALGWPLSAYDSALTHARFLRDRFTFLDIAN